MRNLVTLSNAVDLIIQAPAPILFLDTCVLLDIIRSPYRPEIRNQVVAAAIELISKSSVHPKQVWIIAVETVERELISNIETVKTELERHLKKLDQQITDLKVISKELVLFNKISDLSPAARQIPAQLCDIVNSLLNISLLIQESSELTLRGLGRVESCQPPAKKGRQEYKDCVIIEHYLALLQELRSRNFQQSCIFVSSNHNDFCERSKKLHPVLKLEFEPIGLQFVLDLNHANALLKKSST